MDWSQVEPEELGAGSAPYVFQLQYRAPDSDEWIDDGGPVSFHPGEPIAFDLKGLNSGTTWRIRYVLAGDE